MMQILLDPIIRFQIAMLFLLNEVFVLWTFVHISAVRVFAKTDSRVSQ